MVDTALKVTDLSTLDPTLVDQTLAELNQLMQEAHPEVELTRGVVYDLLQYFSSVFGAKEQTEVDNVIRSASLLEITANPELASDTIVDRVFSNYNITRKPGDNANGSIQIVVSKDIDTVIEDGLIFEANGQQFGADSAFVGRSTTSIVQSSTDRRLVPLGDGTFAFNIEATAVEAGSFGNISRGTQMIPQTLPANYVDSFAATDFIDGFPTETNQEILTRQQEGVAAKTWGDRVNISAWIKENFDRVLHVSTIGFGDPEMDRDQHWIWPTSGGGRTDTYLQTRDLPQDVTLLKTASFIETTPDGSIWQFDIERDDAPGFYEVNRIALPNDPADFAGFEVTQDMRAADLSGDDFVPDIVNAKEAIYTAYQTAVIRFLDTTTPTTGLIAGNQAEYLVSIQAQPELKDIQAFTNDRARAKPAAADNLIKGAVPCYLTINFDLRVPAVTDNIDTGQIQNDLAAYVNNLGFCGQLHASALADVIHNTLVGKAATGAIDMFGRIRRVDGTDQFIRDDAVLIIPDQPEYYLTGRTTIFILDPANIGISIVAAGFPNV
jgi:hypothetical protein